MTATASLLERPLFPHEEGTAPVLLLATDGSPESVAARSAAVDLAARLRAELHIVHAWLPVVSPERDTDRDPERDARRLLFREQLDAVNQRSCVHATHLVEDDPAPAIIDTARDTHADLVVMGGRKLEGFDRWFLGSVSDPVARRAPCSVLVVRAGPRAWPPQRVVVGSHAGDDERRAAAEIAVLLGAELPSEEHRHEAGGEDVGARTLTVVVRNRHRLLVDMTIARRVKAAAGPVLVVASDAVSPPSDGVGRRGRLFLPIL